MSSDSLFLSLLLVFCFSCLFGWEEEGGAVDVEYAQLLTRKAVSNDVAALFLTVKF